MTKDNTTLIARLEEEIHRLYDDIEENEENFSVREGSWTEIKRLKKRIKQLGQMEAEVEK